MIWFYEQNKVNIINYGMVWEEVGRAGGAYSAENASERANNGSSESRVAKGAQKQTVVQQGAHQQRRKQQRKKGKWLLWLTPDALERVPHFSCH